MTKKLQGDLQDGLLSHYLSQARASDGNVEARLDREPFDYREYIRRTSEAYPGTLMPGTSAWVVKWPPKA